MQSLPQELVRELPLINLTDWNRWTTDVPAGALRFSCDIRQSQAAGTRNPLTQVDGIVIQGYAAMRHVMQAINESVGMLVDFYLGGKERVCSEPQEGEEVTEFRKSLDAYFESLRADYETQASASEGNAFAGSIPFDRIVVKQPARLSWVGAFDDEGRFCPQAVGMSYDLNDAFMMMENAVEDEGASVSDATNEAKSALGDIIKRAIEDYGLCAEECAQGWREGVGRSAEGRIVKWSSEELNPDYTEMISKTLVAKPRD